MNAYFLLLNVLNVLLILAYSAYYGWFGRDLQAWFVGTDTVCEKYDKEILLAIGLVQGGKASSLYNCAGQIEFETERIRVRITANDFADPDFGKCYMMSRNYGTWSSERVYGGLSYKTKKYLLEFKEDYLGVPDPSSTKQFKFKKEKVTIK